MKLIEIDAGGIILRTQDYPDDFTLANGVLTSAIGLVIPGTWYPHPAGAQDGWRYDVATGTASKVYPSLPEYQQAALVNVRAMVAQHIEADWPLWRQINADAGIYPVEVKAQKDADIAACIGESNRVEDLIDAATDTAGVDAAVASLNLPTLPVVI